MFTILLQDDNMKYETGSVEQATHTHTHIHIVTGYEDHGSLTKSQTYTDTIQPDDPSKFNYLLSFNIVHKEQYYFTTFTLLFY